MQIHRHPSAGSQMMMMMMMRMRMRVCMRMCMRVGMRMCMMMMAVHGMRCCHCHILDMRCSSCSSEAGVRCHRMMPQHRSPGRGNESAAVMLHLMIRLSVFGYRLSLIDKRATAHVYKLYMLYIFCIYSFSRFDFDLMSSHTHTHTLCVASHAKMAAIIYR